MKIIKFFYIVLVMLLPLCSACQAGGAPTEGASNQAAISPTDSATSPPSPQPAGTPLPEIEEPNPPPAGEANVYGRFLWKGVPIAGVVVLLQGLSQEAGQISQQRTSDEAGVFYFLNIPFGDQFDLIAYVPEDAIPEILEGQDVNLDWLVIDLHSGENISLGNIHLLEAGLMLRSPERGASISSQTVTLEWDAYPGAQSYRVEVKQYPGDYVSETFETNQNTLEIDVPQLACLYGWDVTALNERGEPFARSDQYKDEEDLFQANYDGLFLVEDSELPSCEIMVLSPGNNRQYELGDDLGLAWEPNPLSVKYYVEIVRTRDDRNYADHTLFNSNFVVVDENGQPIGLVVPELSSGQYSFWVVGLAEDGSIVAKSEEHRFTIE